MLSKHPWQSPCSVRGARALQGLYSFSPGHARRHAPPRPLHVARVQGVYGDKRYHDPDLAAVLERGWAAGVERVIITGGTLQGSRAALDLARTDRAFATPAHAHACALLLTAPFTTFLCSSAVLLVHSDRPPGCSSRLPRSALHPARPLPSHSHPAGAVRRPAVQHGGRAPDALR